MKALSGRQFREWASFYRIEPWGFDVEDARLGVMCASIFRSFGAKDVHPSDFMMGETDDDIPELPPKDFAALLKETLNAVEVKDGKA